MKHFLDWSAFQNAGMGDAYADIPKRGGKDVMCPGFQRFSCRQQINNGGFGKPQHIAQILYAAATQQESL